MSKKENLLSQQFGQLTVIAEAPNKGKKTQWQCKCKCGNFTIVASTHLKSGHTTSCGCAHKQKSAELLKKYNQYKKIDDNYSIVIDNNKNECLIDNKKLDQIKQFYWFQNTQGYWQVSYSQKEKTGGYLFLHHYVLNIVPSKGMCIDHIDRNKANNTCINLRCVSLSDNALNRGIDKRNKTGVLGVYQENGNFSAALMVNGTKHSVRNLPTKEAAIQARKTLEQEWMTY